MHQQRPYIGDYVNDRHEEFAHTIPRLAKARLDKILTPKGSSRANKRDHNMMYVGDQARKLFGGYADYLGSMQPQMFQGYSNLFNMAMNPNTYGLVDAYRR